MAQGYKVIKIRHTYELNASGVWEPIIAVSYTTTTTPPVSGQVTIPANTAKDKVAYVNAVKSAIEAEVAGHQAVLGL